MNTLIGNYEMKNAMLYFEPAKCHYERVKFGMKIKEKYKEKK